MKDSTLFQWVKTLTELPGPTNYEEPVQEALEGLWRPHVQSLRRDALGNLVAHWGGQGPRLLIGAHADEICLLVKSIRPDGFIWPTRGTGGGELKAPDFTFVGQPVTLVGDRGPVPGLVTTVTGHIQTVAQREKSRLDWKDIFIDIGALDREEVLEQGIRPGTPVVFDVPTRQLGHHMVGKAMDDRAALAVMTALLTEIPVGELAYDVTLVSTVQEEVGLVGAITAAAGDYDRGLALDVGLAGDIPLVGDEQFPGRLGGGPLLGYKDVGVHYDKRILAEFREVAKATDIPVQPVVFLEYASDGVAWIQHGLPTALLAFPTRYTHSPFEMIHEGDLHQLKTLIGAWLRRPAPKGI